MSDSQLAQLYQTMILEAAKNPAHKVGEITLGESEILKVLNNEHSDCPVTHQVNSTCGDEMYLRADFAKGNVSDIEWAGSGCSISEASASIMTQLLIGLSVEQAQNAVKLFRSMLTDSEFEMEDQTEEILGDAVAFYSVRDFPVRIKCALLAWMGTQNLLEGNVDG